MRTIASGTIVVAALLVLSAQPQRSIAQEPMEPSPIAEIARGLNPLNWQMPQWKLPNFRELLPGTDEKARIKKKKDGLVSEVGKTASNSWNRTKAALNPQKLNPANFFTASSRSPSSKQEAKPGFFRSLFTFPAPPAEPDPNTTVNDFLSQPKPGVGR